MDDSEPALFEMRQCHEYIRHASALYAAWFSFFTTTSLAAIAWTFHASLDKDGRLGAPSLILVVIAFFETQFLFAMKATQELRASLTKTRNRALFLQMNCPTGWSNYVSESPMPDGLMGAMEVMLWTLIANAVLWPLIYLLLFTCWYFAVPVSGLLDAGK